MGRIGFWELLIILVIVMLIFGAGRLPQIAKSIGESVRIFKKSMDEKDGETPGDKTAEKK